MTDRLSVDAFAYELLHGVHLTEVLLGAALESARRLRELYPNLERAAKSAESAMADLYQIAGEVWHEEVKQAETEAHPDGIVRARELRTPNLCAFCEEPLPPPAKGFKRRLICASPDCRRAYHRAYGRDRKRSA